MGNYNSRSGRGGDRYGGRGGGGRGGRDFGRGGSRGGGFGGRDSGRREMFKAVCDECGNECEVPFRPSGDKPVYCSDCFEKRQGSDGGSRKIFDGPHFQDEKRSTGGTDDRYKEQLNAINAKLDKIIRTLEPNVRVKLVSETPETDEIKEETEIAVEKEEKAAKVEKKAKKPAKKKAVAKKKSTTKKKVKKTEEKV